MKKILVSISILLVAMPVFVYGQTRTHWGERKPLSYHIEYLDSSGITLVNENGIDFLMWGYHRIDFVNKILPEKYFGEYPLYFAGNLLYFKVIIKNDSQRTYRNLKIEAFQEFLNIDGGQGEPMGNNNQNIWFVEKLGPNQEIVLLGEFNISLINESGIDQTHLRISHWSINDREEKFDGQFEKGQVILEDFQAGLFCPMTVYEN